jgi:hypothetical protein
MQPHLQGTSASEECFCGDETIEIDIQERKAGSRERMKKKLP